MNSLKCPRCGLVNFGTATNCKRCEAPLDAAAPGATQAPAPTLTAPHPGDGLYYKPSGEVPLVGALGALAGGVAAGVILAFVYSYLVYYIPIIYLNVLCTIGYAVALGFCVGQYLRQVGTKADGDADWFRVDLHHCGGCGQTNTLSVQRQKLTYDSNGKASVSSSALMSNLLLSGGDERAFRTAAAEAAARPQPAYA